ncbi:MAG: Daunorubicin/doxorubicin resistance ATP-binding protein DrrA [Chlamydiae bacterium]|nr:Daunorubicin/doxorubicin resistance ATP-binding protein DrrA [Chlamydiota bacterium]
MKPDSAVILSNVFKTFPGSKKPVEALRGVDLEVPNGEIFGFLGPNGAGKTTTLRILTTLLPFEKGEAFVAGIDVKKNPQTVRKCIGYVSQKGGADLHATGWENLILQGRLYNLGKHDSQMQAKAVVDAFSLSECIHRLVETYSGGQRRRLDIALAMMHQPKILFLDEPTTGLDPQSRDNLWSKIIELKQKGITIFLTSHYLDEVDALADSLAIMDHGKIVALGTPSALKKQISGDIITLGVEKNFHDHAISLFGSETSFIRQITTEEQELRLYVDKGASVLPQILRLLDQANIQFETIQMSIPSLNDVFLQKTGRFLREGASE